jgi:hypothetical protein
MFPMRHKPGPAPRKSLASMAARWSLPAAAQAVRAWQAVMVIYGRTRLLRRPSPRLNRAASRRASFRRASHKKGRGGAWVTRWLNTYPCRHAYACITVVVAKGMIVFRRAEVGNPSQVPCWCVPVRPPDCSLVSPPPCAYACSDPGRFTLRVPRTGGAQLRPCHTR